MRTVLMMVLVALPLAACERSGTETTTTTTPPSPQAERMKTDLNQAGQELKDAGQQVGQQAKPTAQRLGDQTRQGVNEAANKVANWTATQPTTRP